ncbi:efflux RND transporter periplasmic adaptor subunit [Algoriphagus sediminis]|uniref:Efflux RND transporter periplasmic adaptor subunit n=1 Tax=Algoriphagus sediminis TaxID=3057113 RepID=A0ABT7YC17_9BACT|nr:efflux RND transporter periplasmic adaptor subunit [Algoriphagus sediminis]MDN3204054.1 efflux RND transporter periplasmic adaptor subunit [Algoriphagus sediminis]
MKRSLYFAVSILAFGCGEPEVTTEVPPLEVNVVEIQSQDVSLEKDFVAQIYGKVDIPIRARAEGYLEGIHFEEGRMVRKGDLLYTVDSDPFQEGVNVAQSQLASAKVNLTQAENDLARYEPLAAMNAISQKDYDAAVARRDAALAMVDAAEAQLSFEGIQLSYTQIKAPITGLIGKTEAKVGEFVGRDPNPVILNTVSLIDSVRVEFALSENDYLQLFREYQLEERRADKQKPLKLILSDGVEFDQVGYVDFINRQIDATSGTILIQSTFANPNGLIRPGQFARVRAPMKEVKAGKLVPQRAVSEFQGRFFVFKVGEENEIVQQSITILGPYRDYFLISEGLQEGDQVVLEALQKVAAGQKIQPVVVPFESKFSE